MFSPTPGSLDARLHPVPGSTNPFDFKYESPLNREIISTLIVFTVLHAFVIAFCILLLCPNKRVPSSGRYWLFKKLEIKRDKIIDEGSTYLIMPNTRILLPLFQLVESTLTQIYLLVTWLDFESVIRKFSPHRVIFSFVGLHIQFCSYWFMAWSLVIYLLFSKEKKIAGRKFVGIPITGFVNIFFVIFPIIINIVLAQKLWKLSENLSKQGDILSTVVKDIAQGKQAWQANQQLQIQGDPNLTSPAALAANQTIDRVITEIRSCQVVIDIEGALFGGLFTRWTHFWIFVLCFTFPIYSIALCQWLSLIRKQIKKNILLEPIQTRAIKKHALWRTFVNQVVRSLVMLSTILIGIALMLYLKTLASQLTTKLRSEWDCSWVLMLSGAISAFGTVFQAWRIYLEPNPERSEETKLALSETPRPSRASISESEEPKDVYLDQAEKA